MKCYYKQLEVGYFSSFTSSLKIYNIRSSEVSNIGIWRTKSRVMSSASVQFAVLKFLIILILMWKHVIWHQQCDGLQLIFNLQWNVTRMNLTKAVRKLSLEQIKWKSFIHSVSQREESPEGNFSTKMFMVHQMIQITKSQLETMVKQQA